MNRREFLKAAGLVVASAATVSILPLPAKSSYPNFDPTKPDQDWVLITDWFDMEDKKDPVRVKVVEFLENQIVDRIPPGYRHRIAWYWDKPGGKTDPLMQRSMAGWSYIPVGSGLLTKPRIRVENA